MLAGLFEGSTMAVLVMAINVLIGSHVITLTTATGSFGRLMAQILSGHSQESIFLLLLLTAVALQVLRSLAQFTNSAMLARLHANAEFDTAAALFRQFLRLSYTQISRHKAGDLSSYIVQARYPGCFIQALNDAAAQFIIGATLVGILLWISWPMTVAVLVGVAFLSWPLRGLQLRIRQAARGREQKWVNMSECTVEYLQSLRLLHTFNREDFATAHYERVLREGANAYRRGMMLQGMLTPVLESLAVIGVGAFLLVGFLIFRSAKQEVLTVMLGFLFVLYRLLPRVATLHTCFGQLNTFLPATHRIANFLRTDDKQFAPRGGAAAPVPFQLVEFRNISFRYKGTDREAVSDVSFQIPRGAMVALVGESGAGKSTITDLLLRLYDPTSGQILVDGHDLRDLDPKQWRACLGVVSQDGFLFNASVADNIRFGRLDASDAEVIAAASTAGAHEFIGRLANGYQTVVGDRGLRLSGGQRQQLAIARAILRDPQLLLLDEATSSLDNESERLIQRAVEQLGTNRTILAIAHRLSTIVQADKIIVLQHGKILEWGTHQELLACTGYYAKLWRLQAGGNPDLTMDAPATSATVRAA
jgi:ATP-binding cassette subfamily B protein/subfamily B ATP-binding cassette protein MsbA